MHPAIKSQAKQQPTNKGKASKNKVKAKASQQPVKCSQHSKQTQQPSTNKNERDEVKATSKTQSTQQTKPPPPTRTKNQRDEVNAARKRLIPAFMEKRERRVSFGR